MPRSMKVTKKQRQPLDAEGILRVLANVRQALPNLNGDEALPPPLRTSGVDERMVPAHMSADAMEDFEYVTVLEGLESIIEDIDEALQQSHAKMVEDCLRVYYKMEELSLDGEHDDLIPKVKDLREVYERTYSEPIPPQEEADRRARRRAQELAKKKAERTR